MSTTNPKDSSRVTGALRLRKQQRRFEAGSRQIERAARSPEEQLARLTERPGESRRETTRLKAAE